jgi:hypothetical protein
MEFLRKTNIQRSICFASEPSIGGVGTLFFERFQPRNNLINEIPYIIHAMKHKILSAIPTVFSLKPNSDYSRFVAHGGASRMMHDTWIGVGHRLSNSIAKVGRDVDARKTSKR